MGYPLPGRVPPGYPPGYLPPGYVPPGYPPPPAIEPAEPVVEEPAAPAIAPHRPFRFRADFGMGYFNPSDVNAYIKDQVPSNAVAKQGFSEMVMLMSAGVSVAYYPIRFIGIRPNLVYLFAPKLITVEGGSSEGFWLHSLAPGFSLDLAFDQGKLARFFVSPGLSYHLGWFEGYGASGLGLSLALGAELSFGSTRKKGISIALVMRSADLDVKSGPEVASNAVVVDDLDFSSVLVCVGFQLGI
jgi:hypothetical protein